MTQFRSKKDGTHYPIKGGKPVYPEPSKKRLISLIKDEQQASDEYNKYGYKKLSKDEAGHKKFLEEKKKENTPNENPSKGINPYANRQKAMDYYQKGIRVGIQDKRRLDYYLKEARKEKTPGKTPEEIASEHYSYTKMRAMSPYDPSARREWENLGKTGDPKKVLFPKNFFRGYIIGRKLIDDDGKTKPFSYYPRKEHGKPPHWYKTKVEAQRAFKRMKAQHKFPASDSNSVVTKFTEKSYLDRY